MLSLYARPTIPTRSSSSMTRYIDAYANEIAAFIAAVTSGTKLSPTGEDGLLALRLADAALESVKTGRAVRLDTLQ